MIDALPQHERFPLTQYWIRDEVITEYEKVKNMIKQELKKVHITCDIIFSFLVLIRERHSYF